MKIKRIHWNKKTAGISITLAVIALFAVLSYFLWHKLKTGADVTVNEGIISNQATVSWEGGSSMSNETITKISDYTFNMRRWYLLGISKKPSSNRIEDIFNYNLDDMMPNPGGVTIHDQTVLMWDKSLQSIKIYDPWAAEDFPAVDSGSAMWVNIKPEEVGKSIAFYGVEESSPKIIDLRMPSPKHDNGGWAMIGNPFNKKIWIEDKIFLKKDVNNNGIIENETEKKNFCEAVNVGWIADFLMGTYDTGGLEYRGCEEHWHSALHIEPWGGYWLQMYTNGLTMEIYK